MNDLPIYSSVISKLLEQGILVAVLGYIAFTLYRKLMDVQEKRVSDSVEREKTITIALEHVGDTMKSIVLSLEKHDEKK